MLNFILEYSLDLAAFAAVAIIATIIVDWRLRRSGVKSGIGARSWAMLSALLAWGMLLSSNAGENARNDIRHSLEGFPPTYAQELSNLGHSKITRDTPADDPLYLSLISAEKRWLHVNPAVNDIYTFRCDENGKFYLVVDSETDYNHDGQYAGEREQRTAIGEDYPDATAAFMDAVQGRPGFDSEPYTDRWGTWVSATCPIFGPDGRVEGAVGVDFDANTWTRTILIRRTGVLAFFSVALTLLIWSGGIISLAKHEIVRRRDAEERTRDTQERLQTILDHEPEGVFVCGPSGQLKQVNPSGVQLLEVPNATVASQYQFSEFVDQQSRAAYEKWQTELFAGEASRLTLQIKGKRGGDRWIDAHGVPLRHSRQSEPEVLLVVRDVTAARAAEIERENLQNQLVDASRQAGMADIATGVLHNVGNVLNTVNISTHVLTDKLRQSRVGNLSRAAELLQGEKENLEIFFTADERGKQFPDYLGKIAGAIRQDHEEMLGTVRSIADGLDHLKAIVQSQQSFAMNVRVEEPLRPAAVFLEGVKLNIASCERHHVNIVQEFEDLPPVMIDKHKTLQVLVNLISNAKNAIKAADEGQGRITLRLRSSELDNRPSVRFEVHDTGVGIAPENLGKIFSMGFTTRKDGHGFGLHTSANSAKEMGGRISVHSEGKGKGATFALELPCVPIKVSAK